MKNFNDVISNVDEAINNALNGNLEDVISKTKSYAEKATKRSAERLEISRKKIELLDAKTKLSKAFEKYGRLCYEQNINGTFDEEKINSALAEIELQQTRSDMLDKEIEELRELFTASEKADPETEVPTVEVVEVEPTE